MGGEGLVGEPLPPGFAFSQGRQKNLGWQKTNGTGRAIAQSIVPPNHGCRPEKPSSSYYQYHRSINKLWQISQSPLLTKREKNSCLELLYPGPIALTQLSFRFLNLLPILNTLVTRG
jgi:hypothetical protein